MKCPHCLAENQQSARFCARCGKPLANRTTPRGPVVNARDSRYRISNARANYRVDRPWRKDGTVYWVIREGAPVGTPMNLAVPKLPATKRSTTERLKRLNHPALARIIDEAKDQSGNSYFVLVPVAGSPLDEHKGEISWRRAIELFQQVRALLDYLHKQKWSASQFTVPSPTVMDVLHFSVRRIERWVNAEPNADMATTDTDLFKHFLRAFAFDESNGLILVNYALLAPLSMIDEQRHAQIRQDTRLALGMLYWLSTSRRLTRDLQQVRASSGQLFDIIRSGLQDNGLSLNELGEELAHLVIPTDPVRTVPLTAPPGAKTVLLTKPGITRPLSLVLRVEGMTDAGKKRELNEDNFVAHRFDESSGVFFVADGMGGHVAGEVASKMATAEIYQSALADAALLQSKAPDQIREVVSQWIQKANRSILTVALDKRNNMGTTLTGALVIDRTAYVANVGDSRTYLFRFGTLYQLSRDHSLVASLIQAGMLAPEDAYTHPQRNQIFRSLGQQKDVRTDVYEPLALIPGDHLLICSDGLWEMVRPSQMEEIMRNHPDSHHACQAMIDAANENGGEDNITVIIVRIDGK